MPAERRADDAGEMRPPLGPVEAGLAEQAPAEWPLIEPKPHPAEEGLSGAGDLAGALSEREIAVRLQRVRDGDAERPGEMVVAGAGERQRRVDPAQPRVGRGALPAHDRHGLEHLGDLARREPVIAMPALGLDRDETAVEEFREMAARRWGRNACEE